MAEKPKSTADILASIRKGAKSPPTAPAAQDAPTEQPAAPDAGSPVGAEASAADTGSTPVAGTPAAPAGGAAPKGTANILASIRSQKAGGAAASPAASGESPRSSEPKEAPKGTAGILASIRGGGAAKPAAAATGTEASGKAAPAKAAPAGERPSVQEMLKAVKEGVKMPDPGTPRMPARLPGGKPDQVVVKGAVSKSGKTAAGPNRRGVFPMLVTAVTTPFVLAWSLMVLLGGLFTLKGAQFMMPNMVLELPSRFKVGVPSDFPLGTVSEKYKAARGVWIVHTDAYDGRNTIYALASVCTHLGCTPNWLEGEQKYKCPCHGSGFYISGVNFEGPAPRPLERLGIRISEDGQIEVDKSVKFQEELGQWADTKSYIEVV